MNLHEHHDANGHVVDEATMIKDIEVMKMHNLKLASLLLAAFVIGGCIGKTPEPRVARPGDIVKTNRLK